MKWKEVIEQLSGIADPDARCQCADVRLYIANNTKDEEALWSMRNDSSTRVLAAVARRTNDRDHMLELIRGDYNLLREPVLEKLSDDDVRMLANDQNASSLVKLKAEREAVNRGMQDIVRRKADEYVDMYNPRESGHDGADRVTRILWLMNDGIGYLWSVRHKVCKSDRIMEVLVNKTRSVEKLESLYGICSGPILEVIAKRIWDLNYGGDMQ